MEQQKIALAEEQALGQLWQKTMWERRSAFLAWAHRTRDVADLSAANQAAGQALKSGLSIAEACLVLSEVAAH